MPAARHNMKTLSALSRKAHSNVLSLAAALALATRSLVPARCIATSGRQDFRWVLVSAGFAWPKSDPRARRKGRTGADLRKERGGRKKAAALPGCIPFQIHDGFVGKRALMKLSPDYSPTLTALRGREIEDLASSYSSARV